MTLDEGIRIATPLAILVGGGWIRSVVGRIRDGQKVQNDQQKVLEQRIVGVEEEVKRKVGDEEWIRESMRLRNSVEKQGETLARIEGKTDATFQVAAAVSQLADTIKKTQGTQESPQ